ncbi:hypothetical protein [Roseibium sediminis]|uniref:phage tail tube protein n=1 Tax=Roseibium sediminis TaxID=1775174 RepID=UPI00123E0276|nr:hypothetical protein [Roseibium sediminis]
MAERNYTVGRGEVHFAPFLTGTQKIAGYRYLGNTPEFSLNFESETLDHYNSDRGIREKDESVTMEVARSGTLTADDIMAKNLALFLFGTAETVSVAGAVAATETISSVKLGDSYALGVTDSNPVGVLSLSNLVVKNEAGTTTYAAGTDYLFTPSTALLTFLDEGSINDGDNVELSYDVNSHNYESITSGSEPIQGALKFITYNPVGKKFDWLFPYVKVHPNGDLNLKGDEWQTLPFSFDVLRKSGLEAVYVNGAPYTP